MNLVRWRSTQRETPSLLPSRGFTLAEVLVAVAIASAVVLLGTQVFRTVARATSALRLSGTDVGAEQFMRTQGLFAITSGVAAQLFRGSPSSLLFVTRHSLATQEDGPPVLAYYVFDEKLRALRYAEMPLPFGWRGKGIDDFQPREQWPSSDALRGIDKATFEFRGPGALAPWLASPAELGVLPVLVRLRYTRLDGGREVIIEIGAPFSVPVAALQQGLPRSAFPSPNGVEFPFLARSPFWHDPVQNERGS